MNKKPTSKPKKRISLLEFKAWLQGVEELQPRDWSPSPEQWKLIRNKINSIEVTATPPVKEQQPAQPQARVPTRMPVITPPPPSPGGVPATATVVGGPPAMIPGTPPATAALVGPDGRIRTPDIDSSKGYSTNFA